MNNLFVLEKQKIKKSSELFDGVTIESTLLVLDCDISLNTIEIPMQISELVFVSCSCTSDLTIHSNSELTELRFEYGNSFKNINVSGVYKRVIFNTTKTFSRVYYPDDYKLSDFKVVSFLKEAKSNRLEFFSFMANAIKCVGVVDEFFINDATVRDDVTIISSEQSSVSIRGLDSKELHFTGAYKGISINSGCNIGSLYFDARSGDMRNVDMDLWNSKIYSQLQLVGGSDNKVTQFIIKNARYSSIKSLVLNRTLLSCFVISNCDLTNTEVSLINTKLDEMLTEGVSWPFNIEVSHFNYRKDALLEADQKQSVYRQLKSLSQKNKDVDNFLFFRRKEYDTTLSILSCKLILLISYFITIGFDFIGLGRDRVLPVVGKNSNNNKLSEFISVLSNWIILKVSSILSLYGTSLFRPIAVLVFGVPFLLFCFGYYESVVQLLYLSAYVIDPTHKLDVILLGKEVTINPIHSLFFKIFSSSLIFNVVMVFRKYNLSV